MLHISQIQAVIFDVDDTLLDNKENDKNPGQGLHSRSRLAAVHDAATHFDLPALASLTSSENVAAFKTAKTHSLAGAVWNILLLKGLVTGETLDPTNEILQYIVDRKNVLHEDILRTYGFEVAGAADFVRKLADSGLTGKMAIASTAIRRDIDIFLEKYQLTGYFPDHTIISVERLTLPKPDPQAFDLAFRALGLDDSARSQTVAFEDDPRGIQSAKAAGLYTAAITTRFDKDDSVLLAAQPDIIADSYAAYDALIFGKI